MFRLFNVLRWLMRPHQVVPTVVPPVPDEPTVVPSVPDEPTEATDGRGGVTMQVPLIGALNDFAVLAPEIATSAAEFDLPYELIVAQFLQESSWKLSGYRYEPGYDRRYISSTKGKPTWAMDGAWLKTGPSVDDWFLYNKSRAKEQSPNRDWSFVAQTRIAASYGPAQLMYPTAVGLGFRGTPEDLFKPESVRLGVKLLAGLVKAAQKKGFSMDDAVAIGLAQYNGGNAAGRNSDPENLANIEYVRLIAARYRKCWGKELFS